MNAWPVGDELLVTWRGGGDVSVFVSDDPVDAGVDVHSPDGPNQVTVPRSARTYVHLFDPARGFTVAAERLITMDSIANFRDLGGYPTTDGGMTRWGRVFRSARLTEASDADLGRMNDLGITKVFDLRGQAEADERPSRAPSSAELLHRPMLAGAGGKDLGAQIRDGDLASFTRADMVDSYVQMLGDYGDVVAEILSTVANEERVVIHCTAGKDRTGLNAMVLLALAGVGDGHLLDDYEISNQYRAGGPVQNFERFLRSLDIEHDAFDLDALLGAPRPVMRMAIDSIRDRWGSVEGYVASIGIDAPTRAQIRTVMTFPQPG